MEILEDKPSHGYLIQSYRDQICMIGDQPQQHSFILYQNQIIPWGVSTVDAIHGDHLSTLIDLNPECVLFGTGEHFHLLSQKQLAPLIQAQIAYECMPNIKACGSYNLLVSDHRDVCLALILSPKGATA